MAETSDSCICLETQTNSPRAERFCKLCYCTQKDNKNYMLPISNVLHRLFFPVLEKRSLLVAMKIGNLVYKSNRMEMNTLLYVVVHKVGGFLRNIK